MVPDPGILLHPCALLWASGLLDYQIPILLALP